MPPVPSIQNLPWTCSVRHVALSSLCNGLHMLPDQAHLLHSCNIWTLRSIKSPPALRGEGMGKAVLWKLCPVSSIAYCKQLNHFSSLTQPWLCFSALRSPIEFGYTWADGFTLELVFSTIMITTDKPPGKKQRWSPAVGPGPACWAQPLLFGLETWAVSECICPQMGHCQHRDRNILALLSNL